MFGFWFDLEQVRFMWVFSLCAEFVPFLFLHAACFPTTFILSHFPHAQIAQQHRMLVVCCRVLEKRGGGEEGWWFLHGLIGLYSGA